MIGYLPETEEGEADVANTSGKSWSVIKRFIK